MSNTELSFEDLLVTVSALESWVDEFKDSDEDDKNVASVEKVIVRLHSVLAEMQGSGKTRLVRPEDIN